MRTLKSFRIVAEGVAVTQVLKLLRENSIVDDNGKGR
jgi:hypothetical protein